MWNGFDEHLETSDGKTTLYLARSHAPIINEQRCLRHLNSRQAASHLTVSVLFADFFDFHGVYLFLFQTVQVELIQSITLEKRFIPSSWTVPRKKAMYCLVQESERYPVKNVHRHLCHEVRSNACHLFLFKM